MSELSEQIKLACLRWKAKSSFDIVCQTIGEKDNTTRVQMNGSSFIFFNCTSPFNPASVPLIANSKILFYQAVKDDAQFPETIKVSQSVAYYEPNDRHADDRNTYRNLPSIDKVIDDVKTRFDFPLVVKPDQGRLGRNVIKAETPNQVRTGLKAIFDEEPLAVVQDYIPIVKEFRAIIFDGECIILYEKNKDQAIANNNLNPIYWQGSIPILSDDTWLQSQCDLLAQYLLNSMGFVHGGLDIGLDESGQLWLIEANASPMGLARLIENGGAKAVEQLTDKMITKMAQQSGLTL